MEHSHLPWSATKPANIHLTTVKIISMCLHGRQLRKTRDVSKWSACSDFLVALSRVGIGRPLHSTPAPRPGCAKPAGHSRRWHGKLEAWCNFPEAQMTGIFNLRRHTTPYQLQDSHETRFLMRSLAPATAPRRCLMSCRALVCSPWSPS